jgi:hypothetical protein
MGIYRVRNTVNGKSLIGATTNLPGKLNSIRAQLDMSLHSHRELQKDWNELGARAFEFEILDELKVPDDSDYDPSDDLRALEQLWLEKLSPFDDRGYNVKPMRLQ